jgi:uncharacterized membrane protein YkoI
MKTINIRLNAAVAAALAGIMLIPAAGAKAEQTPRPAITMSKARALAHKVYPGTIVKAELERERGGSGLRYSFDMRRGKHWREIGIDAMTGRVLENKRESASPRD